MTRLPIIDKLNNQLIVFENKLYQIKIELKPFYQMDQKKIMKLHDEYISNTKHEFGLASIGIPEFQRIQ